jgi:hypothetical protein
MYFFGLDTLFQGKGVGENTCNNFSDTDNKQGHNPGLNLEIVL